MGKNLESRAELPHNIIVENRGKIVVSGVLDIDCSNESRIVLSTIQGELVIKGEGLHNISLDGETGDFAVYGEINSIAYSRHSVMDGPIRKLFR